MIEPASINKQVSMTKFITKSAQHGGGSVNTCDYMKNKLSSITENSNNDSDATDEIKKLTDELKLYKQKLKLTETKLKIAQMALKKSAAVNLEKDLRIQMLEKKAASQNTSITFTDAFENFVSHFSPNVLTYLRSIMPGSRNDSTFVTKIVHSLYENDLLSLGKKTVTGKGRKNDNKSMLTPEKTSIVKDMLLERITIEQDPDSLTRLKRLNSLLNIAIQNILRRAKPHQPPQSTISTTGNTTHHQVLPTPVNFSASNSIPPIQSIQSTSANSDTSMYTTQTLSTPTNSLAPHQPQMPFTFSNPSSFYSPSTFVYTTPPGNGRGYSQTLV